MQKDDTRFMSLKDALRSGLNRVGFDIVRIHRSPKITLLGIAQLDIRTVIDVGANEGQFAHLISGFFPRADLYCFEPLRGPYAELESWAQTQDGRVHCFHLALGDHEGTVDMHLHQEHTPSSSLLEATDTCHRIYPQTRSERLVPVRLSTLDWALGGLVDEMEFEILLKLDVQGFEDRVLRGGAHVVSKCRALLLEVSLEPLYEQQASFHGIAALAYELGFRYAGNLDQTYGDDGRVVFLDAVFVR